MHMKILVKTRFLCFSILNLKLFRHPVSVQEPTDACNSHVTVVLAQRVRPLFCDENI